MKLNKSVSAAPLAPKRPKSVTHHGITITDPYHWLRADNWREAMEDPDQLSEEIADYLEDENDYTEDVMEPLEGLRTNLVAELRGRIAEDDWTVPSPDGSYAYGAMFVRGGEHPRLVRYRRDDGEAIDVEHPPGRPEVLIDANREALDEGYFRLGSAMHSPDHGSLAWTADRSGSELFTLYLRDLQTGKDQAVLERITPSISFAADAKTIFAVELDDNHRPGTAIAVSPDGTRHDVFKEADPGFFVSVHKSLSGAYIIIDSHDHETSEVRLLDAHDPTSSPLLVAERLVGEEYDVAHHDDALFIRTNREAEDFRIVRAPIDAPGRENWEDIVPHRPGVLIVGMEVFAGYLVWLERENALPRIMIRRLADGDEHQIAFDEEAYSIGLQSGHEFQTETLRFSYSSMTTPGEVWDYDMGTRNRRLRKRQLIPSGHDPAQYVTRRMMAPAPDGESVPISLIHHVSTPIDGTAPCLLYGYGAYGITIPASFSANILSLVDRGFVYAIAHVRGGMDKGYAWYKNGRREHKENTFDDFVAVADHLKQEGYSRADGLLAQGGSAGGLLMGAVANRAPDRFAAIIAEVPFVDVLTTMLDETLPLTPPEWPEWGDPIRDEAAFKRIAGYSPVDNVSAQEYPAIFALAGVSDPRVTYWEPAKWVARLREMATNDPLILLKTNMEAGHGGSSGRFKRLEEIGLIYAFMLAMVGRADATGPT
ncbi:MAG: S9 family peptidase [Pseudomonadota bacterium]